jgi:hypothetical protein
MVQRLGASREGEGAERRGEDAFHVAFPFLLVLPLNASELVENVGRSRRRTRIIAAWRRHMENNVQHNRHGRPSPPPQPAAQDYQ